MDSDRFAHITTYDQQRLHVAIFCRHKFNANLRLIRAKFALQELAGKKDLIFETDLLRKFRIVKLAKFRLTDF